MNQRSIFDLNRRSRAPALPPRARWAARLVVAVPLAAFLAVTLVYFVALGRLLRANLAPVVAGEASRQLNHQVLLGSLDFQPDTLILNNVVVSNRRTFVGSGGEAALSTRRVTIHYSLHDLLFDSGNAGHAFGDITIEHPTVLVERLTEKRFNFTDVIDLLTKKPPKKNAKPFAGRIIVTDATIHARDYMAPANLGTRPANNTLVQGSATVDFHSENNVYFVGKGRGADGRVTDVAVSGDASRKAAGRYRVSVQVSDADAAYWSSYFAQASQVLKKATVTVGRADLDMIIARLGSKPPPGLPVDLEGRVTVRDATIALHDPQFQHLPVQNVAGTAIFTGSGVTVDGSGLAGGQFVRFDGTVFDFTQPQLAFEASAPRIDAVRLARYFPQLTLTPGLRISPAPATAQITGSSVTPVVNIQAVVPAITLRGFTATDVHARALYVNQVLNVPAATFRLNGSGQGVVRVTVNTGTKIPTVSVGGRVIGLDVATLRQPTGQRLPISLGGSADVAFLSTGPSPSQSIVANVTVNHPRVAQTVLRTARARVAFSPAQVLTISRAVAETQNGGIATVSGTVDTLGARMVRLTVHAAGTDMARLLAPYSKTDIGGLAYAQAQVTGPLAAPQVAGQVQLFGARYGRLTTDMITGGVTGDMNTLHLQNVVVRRYPTQVRLSGTVGDLKSQNPQLSLQADLSQGDLTDVLALANQLAPPATTAKKSALRVAATLPALTGTVEGDFHISGRAKSPRIEGSALVTDATIDAYRIRQFSADVAFDDDIVRVDHAALLTEEGTTATAHGQYGIKSGRIDAAFTGKDILLDQFDNLTQPYADTDGVLDVTGRLGGTVKSPTASATVVAHSFSVEGQTFAPFTIGARFANGVLTKTGSPWVFTFQTPGANGAQYIINALQVSLPTPAYPKTPPTLTLSAVLPETAPENLGHLQDALRTSRFSKSGAGQRLLAQLDNLPAMPQGTVWIPSLVVAGSFATPIVQATVAGRGLAIDDNKIGSLAARVSYTGGTKPVVHAEATATDSQAAGVPIQSIIAQGDYADRVITIGRLDARSEQAYLHGSGHADLDGAVDANLDASNVPLSLANLFLPPGKRLSGTVSAFTVQASGQTRAPDLTASINLDSPAVTVTTPATTAGGTATQTQYALDSVRSGTITLAAPQPGSTGKVLAVTDLAVFKGGRRLATLSGTLPVSFGGAARGVLPNVPTDQPLHADLQIADLSVLSLFSPDVIDPKRTSGGLTATVDYGGGTRTTPQLLGQVMISGGSLGIQGFDTAVTGLKGTVTVQNDHLVAALTAQSTQGGTLSLSGGGTLGATGQAALRLTAKDVRLDETGRGNFLAKTYNTGVKGRINGSVTIAGPWLSPLIATQPNAPIVVADASGTLPSASPDTTPTKVAPLVDPRFNVALLIGSPGKTVSVRSAFLQADASGDVELSGRETAPELRAHLTVARGQFILPPATRLVIVRQEDGTSNTVDMRYPVASPDPADNGAPTVETRVHLIAQANVSPSAASLAANQSVVGGVTGQAPPQATSIFNQTFGSVGTNRYTITARIDGLLNVPDRLTLDLSSSPSGLSRSQMLASLVPEGALQGILGGGQGAETAFKTGLQEAFNTVAIPTLLSPLEQGVQTALGLEDFSVDYSPDAPVNVTLTKQIAPRLLVTYIRAVGARQSGAVSSVTLPPEYQLKLGYGLTNHLQVSVSTDDQKNDTLALEGVFAF